MERDTNHNDLELVKQVKEGNKKAFSELVRAYQKPLLRLCVRFVKDIDTAQDVVQEAFIKAYEKLDLFEGRASFKSWLFQIAVNTAKNKLRERRYDVTDIENVPLAVNPQAEMRLVNNSISIKLNTEVEKLPLRQKTSLVLRIYEDLSFQEIADIMECPYDTAKANYRHALLKLREQLQEDQELRMWSSEVGHLFMEMNRLMEVDT